MSQKLVVKLVWVQGKVWCVFLESSSDQGGHTEREVKPYFISFMLLSNNSNISFDINNFIEKSMIIKAELWDDVIKVWKPRFQSVVLADN